MKKNFIILLVVELLMLGQPLFTLAEKKPSDASHADSTQFEDIPVVSDNFLGVRVIPGAQILLQEKKRLGMIVPMTHDEVFEYYKSVLKDEENIKFRYWKDSTYIEDDGARPWHSVTIYKEYNNGTYVQIDKDKWSWIIGMLVLRFAGVFIVLFVLYVFLSLAGRIISKSLESLEANQKERLL